MKKIYIAVVQEPMQSLDCTELEVFGSREEANAWVESKLKRYDEPDNGFTRDDMNYEVYQREVPA